MRNRPPIPVNNILQEDIPPIRWVLHPWITYSSKTVLFGEFGSMKSWVLLHLALCLASGKDWLGYRAVPQSVLYIDEEMSERTLRARIKRLAKGLDITGSIPLQAVSHSGIRFDGQGADKLMAYLNEHNFRPSVVIVETLRRVLVGKENESSDVGQFWRNVDPLCLQGVTVIVAHHMRKPKTDSPDPARYRASGSTDILAGCNVGLALTRPEKTTLVLACVKNQDVEEGLPMTIKVRSEQDPGPFYLERATEYIDDWGKAMLELCALHPDLTHAGIYNKYQAQIGYSQATYFRRMTRLKCGHGQSVEPAAISQTPGADPERVYRLSASE